MKGAVLHLVFFPLFTSSPDSNLAGQMAGWKGVIWYVVVVPRKMEALCSRWTSGGRSVSASGRGRQERTPWAEAVEGSFQMSWKLSWLCRMSWVLVIGGNWAVSDGASVRRENVKAGISVFIQAVREDPSSPRNIQDASLERWPQGSNLPTANEEVWWGEGVINPASQEICLLHYHATHTRKCFKIPTWFLLSFLPTPPLSPFT